MERHEFCRKFANVPLGKRDELLSNDYRSPLFEMTLADVYREIQAIDDKLRKDEVRREELLRAIEKFLT
jgi:hypothetical protein